MGISDYRTVQRTDKSEVRKREGNGIRKESQAGDLNSGQKMALLRYCHLSLVSLPIVKDELLQQNTLGSSQGHITTIDTEGACTVSPPYSDQIEAYTLNVALFKY